jgi:hypothetical protein
LLGKEIKVIILLERNEYDIEVLLGDATYVCAMLLFPHLDACMHTCMVNFNHLIASDYSMHGFQRLNKIYFNPTI